MSTTITSNEEHEYLLLRFDSSPPLSSSSSPRRHTHQSLPITKPNSRFLSFLLQALVMALVISLFFLFVGIAALLLLHICIAGRALRRRRRRHHPQSPLQPNSPSGLSSKDLQRLPCFDHGAGIASDCAVCLEGCRQGERCRILPGCKHVFHAGCVDKWLVKVPACPVCRAGVVSEEGRVGLVGG